MNEMGGGVPRPTRKEQRHKRGPTLQWHSPVAAPSESKGASELGCSPSWGLGAWEMPQGEAAGEGKMAERLTLSSPT